MGSKKMKPKEIEYILDLKLEELKREHPQEYHSLIANIYEYAAAVIPANPEIKNVYGVLPSQAISQAEERNTSPSKVIDDWFKNEKASSIMRAIQL
ncbi:hypothetical protein ACFLZJ_01685 [Nanoarchaeota archaeon]